MVAPATETLAGRPAPRLRRQAPELQLVFSYSVLTLLLGWSVMDSACAGAPLPVVALVRLRRVPGSALFVASALIFRVEFRNAVAHDYDAWLQRGSRIHVDLLDRGPAVD